MLRVPALITLALATACSRTGLAPGRAVGIGGEGGAAGPTSSGSGGSGGGGAQSSGGGGAGGEGGDPPCTVLTLHEPVLTLAGGELHHQRQPVLTEASGDGNVVTVVAEWTVVESPSSDPPAELRHTSFTPWTDWPADGSIDPSYLADLNRGVTFAAARSGDQNFAVLAGDGDRPAPPSGLTAHLSLTPFSGMQSLVSPTIDEFAEVAHFITPSSSSAFLLGFGKPVFHEQTYVGVATLTASGASYAGPFHVGCGSEAPSLDAEAVGEGWLMAAASAAALPGDNCFNSVLGLADRIHFARVDAMGAFMNGSVLETGPAVVRVRTAPRGRGMWVTWTHTSDGDAAPIRALRVDTDATLIAPAFDLAVPPDHLALPQSIAADRVGSRLVVGWIDDPQGNPPDVAIAVHDDEGLIAEAIYEPEGSVYGAVSVLGSPAGDALLVAWSELVGRGQSRVRVARFDCSP